MWSLVGASTQCNQLLGAGRMNRYRVVEITLARAHFYRHGETLNDLVHVPPDQMAADDSFALADRYELHQGRLPARQNSMVERGEARLVYLHFTHAVERARCLLAETDGANRWVAEDNGRYVFIVEPRGGLVAKKPIR